MIQVEGSCRKEKISLKHKTDESWSQEDRPDVEVNKNLISGEILLEATCLSLVSLEK